MTTYVTMTVLEYQLRMAFAMALTVLAWTAVSYLWRTARR